MTSFKIFYDGEENETYLCLENDDGTLLTADETDEIIAQLTAFHETYSDAYITGYNTQIRYSIETASERRELWANIAKAKRKGYVYLFEHNGVYKIGKTKREAEQRKNEVANQLFVNPDEITVVHVIAVEDRNQFELTLHAMFKDKQIPGKKEWFTLSPDDVSYIKSLGAQDE